MVGLWNWERHYVARPFLAISHYLGLLLMHGWIHSTFQALNLVWKGTFILGYMSGLFLSLISRSPQMSHDPLLKPELG